MRNVDRIKQLNHELGRYKKKVADQDSRIRELEEQIRDREEGASQVACLVDAVLAAVASSYGTAVMDDDDTLIGYRLELEGFELERMRELWQVSANKQGDTYTIGVMARERAT